MSLYGLLGLAAWIVAYLLVAGLRRWAERRQILDIPNERSSHTQPTPRGGGLAIVLVTLAGLAVYMVLTPDAPRRELLVYAGGAALIAGVSGLDDVRSLPARVRLAAHLLAALVAAWGIGRFEVFEIPAGGAVALGGLAWPVTLVWVVGLTNAYNFMDGIDGLAGGQAVTAGLGWVILGALSGQAALTVLGLLIAAGSLGFLGHNWPPARIFMGDVGSAFLGYSLAVMTLMGAQSQPALALAGAALVWPFLFDSSFTFLRRLRRGENVFAAHRSHLYQRLVIAGWPHRSVTLLYLAWAALGGLAALALYHGPGPAGIIGLASLLGLGAAVWAWVRYRERARPAV